MQLFSLDARRAANIWTCSFINQSDGNCAWNVPVVTAAYLLGCIKLRYVPIYKPNNYLRFELQLETHCITVVWVLNDVVLNNESPLGMQLIYGSIIPALLLIRWLFDHSKEYLKLSTSQWIKAHQKNKLRIQVSIGFGFIKFIASNFRHERAILLSTFQSDFNSNCQHAIRLYFPLKSLNI